jgi:hypothetical protein
MQRNIGRYRGVYIVRQVHRPLYGEKYRQEQRRLCSQ